MNKESKIRAYILPLIATVAMILFWWAYSDYCGDRAYIWWLVATIVIFAFNYALWFRRKK